MDEGDDDDDDSGGGDGGGGRGGRGRGAHPDPPRAPDAADAAQVGAQSELVWARAHYAGTSLEWLMADRLDMEAYLAAQRRGDGPLQDAHRALAARWTAVGAAQGADLVRRAAANFGVADRHESPQHATAAINRGCRMELALISSLERVAAAHHLQLDLVPVKEATIYAAMALHMEQRVWAAGVPAFRGTLPSVSFLDHIQFANAGRPDKVRATARVVKHALAVASLGAFRQKGGYICVPLYTPGGAFTHHWTLLKPLEDWIWDVTPREVYDGIWQILCQKGAAEAAAVALQRGTYHELPKHAPSRCAWSFSNGIFFADHNVFVPYGSPESAQLTRDMSTIRYFDLPFDNCDAALAAVGQNPDHTLEDILRAVPTPHMDTILNGQLFSPQVQTIFWMMIGSLFFDIGQTIWVNGRAITPKLEASLFFQGKAGTGKSTILKLIQEVYGREHVGVFANNMEETFGLEGLLDKLIVLGFDMTAAWRMEEGNFMSMVSGEEVVVAQKNKVAKVVRWTASIAFASNTQVKFPNSGGNFARRVILFMFERVPPNVDTTLQLKLLDEMPAFIKKATVAFHSFMHRLGTRGLWTSGMLPAYFLKTRRSIEEHNNTLARFVAQDASMTFVFDPRAYVDAATFAEMFKAFHKAESRAPPPKEAAIKAFMEERGFVRELVDLQPAHSRREGVGLKKAHYYRGLGLQTEWPDVLREQADAQAYEAAELQALAAAGRAGLDRHRV